MEIILSEELKNPFSNDRASVLMRFRLDLIRCGRTRARGYSDGLARLPQSIGGDRWFAQSSSLYRILVAPQRGINTAQEVAQSARGITEAGNFLARILIEFILKKAGVKSGADGAVAARSKLELNIRDYKETLFNERFLFVALSNGLDVEIELEEFLSIDAVKGFWEALRATMAEILEAIDFNFIEWILSNRSRYLSDPKLGGYYQKGG